MNTVIGEGQYQGQRAAMRNRIAGLVALAGDGSHFCSSIRRLSDVEINDNSWRKIKIVTARRVGFRSWPMLVLSGGAPSSSGTFGLCSRRYRYFV